MLETLIEAIPDPLFVKDEQGSYMRANRRLANLIGYTDETRLIGANDFSIYPEAIANELTAQERLVMETGIPMIDVEEQIIDRSGRARWLTSFKYPLYDTSGTIIGLVGICRDITDHKKSEALRLAQAEILELIIHNLPLADILSRIIALIEAQIEGIYGSILLMDADGLHLRPGTAPNLPEDYVRLTDGFPIGPRAGSCGTAAFTKRPVIVADIESDPLWADFKDLILPFGLRSCWSMPIISDTDTVLATYALYSNEVRLPTEAETALISMTTKLVGIAMERKIAEDRIHFMAMHDPLTGLPNRTMLTKHLVEVISHSEARHDRVGVAFIDLDNFKAINDRMGHGAGDGLLRIMAARMQECVRPIDMVGRLGGDEFVILFTDSGPQGHDAMAVLQRLRAAVAEPVSLEGELVSTTSSIGLAIFPQDGEDADALLTRADVAMYRAKTAGRDNIQIYTAEFTQDISARTLTDR